MLLRGYIIDVYNIIVQNEDKPFNLVLYAILRALKCI